MDTASKISTSSLESELTHQIKCHSSKQLFCRENICFIEYAQIAPTRIEYECIELHENIDHKCNKTIDFIHRECCSKTFCNSRLFNHDFYHRWSILNTSSINANDLLHIRLRIVLNVIIIVLLFGLLRGIVICLSKPQIKRIYKTIHQQTSRSRKLQPSVSLPVLINASKFSSLINSDNSNNHIIQISPCSLTPAFSIETYCNDPLLNLICHHHNK